MKKRILIGVIALLLVAGLVLPMSGALQASPDAATLTVNYYTENGNAVYIGTVKVTGTGGDSYSQQRNTVTGSWTFTGLESGKSYNIKSTKGLSRTDVTPALNAGSNTFDVPCSDLVVNLKTESSHNLSKSGTAFVQFGGNNVDSYSFYGSHTFYLLDGTYDVKSTMDVFSTSRTDTGIVVGPATTTFDVPCSDLVVNLYANGNLAWPINNAQVKVKDVGGPNGATQSGVNGTCTFYLLDATYDVKSVNGSTNRKEGSIPVGPGTTTLNVPVARFKVTVVKGDFTPQSNCTIQVVGVVPSVGGVNTADFSLLASSPLGVGNTGAGQYTFKATKNLTIAQTTAMADPPPGLAGVVLMIP